MPAADGVKRLGALLPALVGWGWVEALFFLAAKGPEGIPCRAKGPAIVEDWR